MRVNLHKSAPEELPVHEPLFLFGFLHQVQHKKLPSHPRELKGLNIMSCHTATLLNQEGLLQVSCVRQISTTLLSQRITFQRPHTKPKGEQSVQKNNAKQMGSVWMRTKKQTLTSVKKPLELVTATLNRGDFSPPLQELQQKN